jgi:dihydrofolate reductase (trimethoprim resistance protein)
MTPNPNPSPELRESIARIVCHIVVQITCAENATDASVEGQVDKAWHHWTDTADRILALSPQTLPAPGEELYRHWNDERGVYEYIPKSLATVAAANDEAWPPDAVHELGAWVQKKGRASWRGRIVGWYRTNITALGYAVESAYEPGSVQIYPETALLPLDPAAIRLLSPQVPS